MSSFERELHTRPGITAYRNWLDWTVVRDAVTKEPSASVRTWGGRLKRALSLYGSENIDVREVWQSSVLACGYDFKKNKARAWIEVHVPYFDPPPSENYARWSKLFSINATALIEGASAASKILRDQTKIAKFGIFDSKKSKYKPRENLPKETYEYLYETFWRETEQDFLAALAKLRDTPADETMTIREDFLRTLRTMALRLFDEAAGTDDLADQDARRIVEARSGLGFAFSDTGDVRKALGIFTAEAQQKAAKRKAKKKEAAA